MSDLQSMLSDIRLAIFTVLIITPYNFIVGLVFIPVQLANLSYTLLHMKLTTRLLRADVILDGKARHEAFYRLCRVLPIKLQQWYDKLGV